ncbi:MAG TPA: hypothetical protein VF331_11145 [Polyangiales bacterium]
MATPSNKPRDIKNLKARLGRTITPGQAGSGVGSSPSFPPGGSVPPPSVRDPLGGPVGGPVRGPASVPPPAMQPPRSSPGSVPAPGSFPGAPGSFPGGIAAPAFATRQPTPQPAARQLVPSARAPMAAPAPAARFDPLAAAAPSAIQTKHVTLVIDDSAVKEDEIGRKSRARSMVLVLVGILLGLAVGFGVGNTRDQRHQYSMAVADGKAIYAKIQEVSKQVEQAKGLVKQVVEASTGGPGQKATVNYEAIESLVSLKRPFSANEFHRRLYRAFGDNVVDDLFDYYNGVNQLWDGFTALGAKTAGAQKRDALSKSAAATDGLLNTDYGVVFAKNGEALSGALVFVTIPPAKPEAAEPDKGKKKGKADKEDEGVKVKVSSAQGGQEVERTVYTGQDGMKDDAEKYVLMLDKIRSRTILGESANLFGKFRGDVMELSARMDKAGEVQGRLVKELGQVASLSE